MLSKEKLAHELEVKKIIKETEDTYSFVFGIPNSISDKFKYKAGQFVTLFVHPKGEEVRRSYSLSSSPDWDEEFKISVKRVDGGLVSNWLIDDVKEGDKIFVTPPAGRFCLPADEVNEFIFFAAGSGITPIISLVKSALKKNPNCRVRLCYSSRDADSIIFQDELNSIQEKMGGRFAFLNFLSGKAGRIGSTDVKEFFESQECSKEAQYFLCGPEGFMATVQAALEILGVPRSSIERESFVTALLPSDSNYISSFDEDSVMIGDLNSASEPATIEAEVDGQWVTVEAKEGVSILESLLEAGHNPPYSCMDGACMACMGKVQEGLVYQDDMGILTEDNTEVGECLTCQAKPASKNVKVTYEI